MRPLVALTDKRVGRVACLGILLVLFEFAAITAQPSFALQSALAQPSPKEMAANTTASTPPATPQAAFGPIKDIPAWAVMQLISYDGGFEVYLPGEPVHGSLLADAQVQGEYFAVNNGREEYFVGYFSHPYVGLEKAILQSSMEQAARLFGGQLTDVADIERNGLKGKTFLIREEGGRQVRGLHLCSSNSVYLLRYLAPGAEFDSAKAEAFLNSFSLMPQTASQRDGVDKLSSGRAAPAAIP